MAKFYDRITHLINSQVPDFVLEDHPKFVQFLKSYYTFMESAELSFTSVETTNGILLETETNQQNYLVLDGTRIGSDTVQIDENDRIIYEDSSFGKFTNGEIITGQTSGATATILSEDLDNDRIFITSQNKFIIGETVTGNTSNASGIINNYKPNPVTNIQELLDFRDPDKVISNFLTKFRNELLNTLPENLDTDVNKRNLLKNVRSLYRVKGTSVGHQIFFRLLFGEESETTYPREQVLRVSDGKWGTSKILRAIATTGDTSDLVGRTIEGQSSDATAVIENVFKFQIGDDEVTEFILNEDTIDGTFTVGEEIRGTETDDSDTFIKATVTGLPDIPTVTNSGSLYSSADVVAVTGGGEGENIQIDNVGRGGITEFIIDDAGTNYTIGDSLTFTNTGTGGGGASAKVSVVNGGFTQEESTSTIDDHIVLEDETVRGDPYTGNKFVQETATGSGDITDVRIVSAGFNYLSLPTVVVTSSTGTGANIKTYGANIGRVQSIKIVEPGKEHQTSPTPPTLSLPTNMIVIDVSGAFSEDETVTALGVDGSTTISATVNSFDTNRGLLILSGATGTFDTDVTITGGTSGATATIKKFDQATATTTVVSTLDTAGTYINQDGHVSENTMKIQDSLVFQDFSYIIKVGRSINEWRDSFKKTMHSAGYYFAGEVSIVSTVNVEMRNITGLNSSTDYTPVAGIVNTLFTTIFGRRLGTTDDGTSLNANPILGVDPLFDTSTTDVFTPNTRDVTLKRTYTIIAQSKPKVNVRSEDFIFGYVVAGPRMKNIDKFKFSLYSGSGYAQNTNVGGPSDSSASTIYISPMLMQDWAEHRIIGTKDSDIDGELVQIGDISVADLKTYIALPTQITIT